MYRPGQKFFAKLINSEVHSQNAKKVLLIIFRNLIRNSQKIN